MNVTGRVYLHLIVVKESPTLLPLSLSGSGVGWGWVARGWEGDILLSFCVVFGCAVLCLRCVPLCGDVLYYAEKYYIPFLYPF